ARAGISAEPDEALVVDMNAVLALRPFITGARSAAPAANEIAVRTPYRDWRSSKACLTGGQRAWTRQNPNIVLCVDRDRGRVAHAHIGGDARPGSVDLELRQGPCLSLRGVGGIDSKCCGCRSACGNHQRQ